MASSPIVVRAKEAGLVLAVREGRILVDAVEYGGVHEALVKPGEYVKKNQPIGITH